MSGPGPSTTWEDLANLGWSKQNRGRPPRHALNEGFALNFGWLSHDVLVGQPRIASESADHIRSSTIVWNSQNLEDVAINWTETWTNSTSASLSVSNRAGVSLSQSISIMGVAGSEFSFDISTESTSEETQQNIHQLSATWAIVVRAGKTVHLERIRTIRQRQATCHQNYGLSPNSLMATQGGQ
ncbi:hypothetical protein B0H13DRAFT_2346695 [Mycena leptocephala]|nr:hypothetical protein B0H13DRAFT_2346695 [Mycena leptocephala]